MKRRLYLMFAALVALTTLTVCGGETPEKAQVPVAAGYSGAVIETMNTAGYTYVRIDTGKEKIWVAAPECKVKVGDKVIIPPGAPMKAYHSKTLNRTFDMVYFVSKIMIPGSKGKTSASPPADIDFSGIKKPVGGKTVAELSAQKGVLSGKEVLVRGKVVKFSPKIMGKNWIHLRDGTGAEGANDLTITTMAMAKVGDTVLVSGVVAVDKDFGSGYKYDIIIEDAKVKVE
jgi:hypothetical protein